MVAILIIFEFPVKKIEVGREKNHACFYMGSVGVNPNLNPGRWIPEYIARKCKDYGKVEHFMPSI